MSPNTQKPKTLIRLDASPYQHHEFFKKEQSLARLYRLNYIYLDMAHRGFPKELPSDLKGPYVLVSNTHTRLENIPESVLRETALLIHPNSGYDNFKAEWIKKQNFPVVRGNLVRAQAVTEYILGQLFYQLSFREHEKTWHQERTWSRSLLDKEKILIVGKGQIGTKLYEVLRPLSSHISFYDPFKSPDSPPLKDLLLHHRLILLTCSLNPSSYHLLGEEEFRKMHSHFILINAARGSLIHEPSLYEALEQKPRARAILDVFEKEPFDKSAPAIPNLHRNSHVAGVSQDLDDRILAFEKKVLQDFYELEPPSFEKEYEGELLSHRLVSYNGEDILI